MTDVRRVVGAGQPAFDDQGKDALEFATVLRGVAQDMQGFGFAVQQVREQGADDRTAMGPVIKPPAAGL